MLCRAKQRGASLCSTMGLTEGWPERLPLPLPFAHLSGLPAVQFPACTHMSVLVPTAPRVQLQDLSLRHPTGFATSSPSAGWHCQHPQPSPAGTAAEAQRSGTALAWHCAASWGSRFQLINHFQCLANYCPAVCPPSGGSWGHALRAGWLL